MASPWCRLWGDMPNDPKWRTIARVSKQRIGDVVAVYVHMMTCASSQANATERGRTVGWRDEDVATALDLDIEQVEAIRAAMQGRVLEGDYLSGWDKRQAQREDEGAAGRAKAFREREKAKKQTSEPLSGDAKNVDRTQPNATERKETTEVEVDIEVDKKQKDIGAGAPPLAGTVLEQREAVLEAIERKLEQELVTPTPVPKGPKFDGKAALMTEGVTEQLAADYLQLRKTKKAPFTQTALDGLKREANKAGRTVAQAVATCCEKGWAGFNADWVGSAAPARANGRPSINAPFAAGADDDIFNQMRRELP